MVSHDPYDILGVKRSATKEEITDAYRELLAKYYLKNVKQFKLIVRAYLQLCGLEEDTPDQLPSESSEGRLIPIIRWARSNRYIIVCFVGGSILLGFAAYKKFQLGNTLNQNSLQSAGLIGADNAENVASQTIEKSNFSFLSNQWKWITELTGPIDLKQVTIGTARSTQSVGSPLTAENVASQTIEKSNFSFLSNQWKWITELTGPIDLKQATIGQISSQNGDGESATSIVPAVSSVSSSTLGACSKALKWTAGSSGAAWHWTLGKLTSHPRDGESATSIASTVSSVSSSTLEACSKALKWTAGSAGAAWHWTLGKLTSQPRDGESATSIASTVSSVSSSTLGACSKALKWTAGSAGAAWKWSAGKLSPQVAESTDSSSVSSVVASTVRGMSKAWKWATGSTAADTTSSSMVSTISKSSIGAISKVWQWTTGKASTQSEETAKSAVSKSVHVLSKIWKWGTGQG